MLKSTLRTTVGAMMMLFVFAQPTLAAVERFMPVQKGFTPIIRGHLVFCQENPAECKVVSKDDRRTPLTKKAWRRLNIVNKFVNNIVKPKSDKDIYGKSEHWAYPVKQRDGKYYGDCEDYVLYKRHVLLQEGWPASNLLITVVKKLDGEGHAVLTVRTTKGDFVLDNLSKKVRLWNKAPYLYMARVDTLHSGKWRKIAKNRHNISIMRKGIVAILEKVSARKAAMKKAVPALRRAPKRIAKSQHWQIPKMLTGRDTAEATQVNLPSKTRNWMALPVRKPAVSSSLKERQKNTTIMLPSRY